MVFNMDRVDFSDFIEPTSSTRVKRELIKQGYSHQMSFYGVSTDRETGESTRRRVELMANTPYTEKIVRLCYELFQALILPSTYSIWVYNSKWEAVRLVIAYE